MTEEYLTYGHRLEQHIADTAAMAWEALDAGKIVLFEGAQGAMLDIDHGTYPFVTSLEPGRRRGLRRRRRRAARTSTEVWGIAKAYTTRVGAGPVPERAPRRGRRGDPPARRRVRHDHRAPAAHRLARPRRAALRRRHQRADRAGRDEARRAQRLRPHQGLHALPRRRGGGVRRRSPTTSRCCTRPGGVYEELPGWTEDIGECAHRVRSPAGGARLPALHRGADRRAGRARRRRARARAGRLVRRRGYRTSASPRRSSRSPSARPLSISIAESVICTLTMPRSDQ